ncbi:MAG TPA: phage holin family protein [Bryobacteraceae bacterium]|nr:phage holin family protein [Bryobacteraceae bacterium]
MRINLLAVWKWLCAALVALWVRDVPLAMHTLIWLMAIDYATGLMAATLEGVLSSRIGLRGLAQKGAIVCFLLMGHWVETRIGREIGAEVFGAFGYSVNELISIVENFARLGVPLPDRVIDGLAAARRLWVMKRITPEQLERLKGK